MQSKRIFLAVLLLFVLSSCNAVTSQQPANMPTSTRAPLTPSLLSLRSLAQARGLFIGTAVNYQALQSDARYRDTLSREFNFITPETSLKFAVVHPDRDVYNFHEADTILAFAKAHTIQMRGHNLVWPYGALPSWVTSGNFSRDELMAILHEHIKTVVSHYRGQISIWDVVNEGVNLDGTLKDSLWLRVIGPDYIDWAFRWAHEANPDAKLFYNDFGGEDLGHKSDAIYALVKGLLQRGVPIAGVGFELHLSLDRSPLPQDMLANMKRLAALGLEVHITEMDVATWGAHGTTAEKLSMQAQIYHNMLSVCLAASNCKTFVIWGFTDRYSWIPAFTGHPDAPLIFDKSYRPKPAYYALTHTFTQATALASR